MNARTTAATLLALAAVTHVPAPQSPSRAAVISGPYLHDSHDRAFRTPTGAVPVGTPVTIRLLTPDTQNGGVLLHVWNERTSRGVIVAMHATGAASSGGRMWQATIGCPDTPAVLNYRFTIETPAAPVFYEDAPELAGHGRLGGAGAASERSPDRPWELTCYDARFRTPAWLQNAVIYQIFPDRFRDGDPSNDPLPGLRAVHGLPVVSRHWDDRPEGSCRYYTEYCCGEDPRGRDFFGGDLEGIRQKLPYLRSLGVTAIYLNPIFESPTNHRYDTSDYDRIDPALGTNRTFTRLAADARRAGMRLILDGVFNHVSSDSRYFNKEGHYGALGAYQSKASSYFPWFTFDPWPEGYRRWAAVASMPTLTEDPSVKRFIFGPGGIAERWLDRGASGWRLDVMQDKSHEFWREFRRSVKRHDPDAAIVGEYWDDAAAWLTGDQVDSVMNYRLRRALIGFVNGSTGDANGPVADLPPTRFDIALQAISDSYPPQALRAMMNIVDSHDTKRILWTLTPGRDRPDEKERPDNVEQGIRRLKLLSLLQFTMTGAPTIYYGTEAGVTGDTDPDDRRPFPWGHERRELIAHYQRLSRFRRAHSFLRVGSTRRMLADDEAGVYAFLRANADGYALVVANRSSAPRRVTIPTAGIVRAGAILNPEYGDAPRPAITSQVLTVDVGPVDAVVLIGRRVDLVVAATTTAPQTRGAAIDAPLSFPVAARSGAGAAPDLRVSGTTRASITLEWSAAPAETAGYELLRDDGDGVERLRAHLGADVASFTDTAVLREIRYRYAIRALTAGGARGQPSRWLSATPAPAHVRVVVTVTTPDTGGRPVFVAANVHDWDPAGVKLAPATAGTWTWTWEATEGQQLEYKYTLGNWDLIEKGPDLGEVPTRSIRVAADANGSMSVSDTVARWRVHPAGCSQQ